MAKSKALICPYCGDTQPAGERCRSCGGLFEPLSRQATHNAMGPWFVRDETRPFQPGCSYETLVKLVERGQVTRLTIVRGPTTKQFWTIARRVPGVAHLLGYCHNCDAPVDVDDHGCHACGVPFGAYLDRNYMGLPEVRPLPWEAPLEEAARQEASTSRMMDFRRVSEPLGISSFASDDELRNSGLSPMPSIGAAPAIEPAHIQATAYSAAARGEAAFPAPPQPGFMASAPPAESSLTQLAVSAAQRRVQQQQRTIRLLAISIVGLIVISAVLLLAAYGGFQLRQPGTQSAAERSVQPADASANAPRPDSPAATAGDASAQSQIPAAGESTVDFTSDFAAAQEMIAAGQRTDRPLADRIADYEQAIILLKSIENSPGSPKPDGLLELIQQSQKALDDLRLKAFFP